ncbi:MAG: hypothetical protein WD206_09430 [Actinomycetota bacterium]
MHKEAGERRDFLPDLVASLAAEPSCSDIVLEEGYGSGIDASEEDYRAFAPEVRFSSYEDALRQDVVVVIRCPDDEAIGRMRPGALLVSMLHYPTRPNRTAMIAAQGLGAVSLDSIADDLGRRLIENLESVGWNGVRAAFEQLERRQEGFDDPARGSVRVTVLGSGHVASHAIHAATRYGDTGVRDRLAAGGVPGVEVTVVDYDLTSHEQYMLDRLAKTDLLVDATQRPDPTRAVIPNRWLARLPADALVLDLSVDPYDLAHDPPLIKGIEGIPHGDLDRWVFEPDDPAFDDLDPRIDRTNRRRTLSCSAWPGLSPRRCMDVYGEQLEPVLRFILHRPVDQWSEDGVSFWERAVARAELHGWLERHG